MKINIVELKNKIKGIKNMKEKDRRVLSIVDSFWGACSDNYIKANLASEISKYAGCKAWKIAMSYVYDGEK